MSSLGTFLSSLFQISTTKELELENLEEEVKKTLDFFNSYEGNRNDSPSYEPQNGRIGPKKVVIQKTANNDTFHLDETNLIIESHGNFSSSLANVCVWKGKWMYEITLMTAGIQQLGWCLLDCPFTTEEGVGDSEDSYAYDGKRIKKWNGPSQGYGQAWVSGDIIGVCINLDQGEISFYRNGVSLGVAFNNKNLRYGNTGLAYFPGFSLSLGERSKMNFGGTPFRYPIPEYKPLEQPPSPSLLSKARYLLECLEKLISYYLGESLYNNIVIPKEDLCIITDIIFQFLGPILQSEYIVASSFYPLLESLIVSNRIQYITKLVELMSTYLEAHEFNNCFKYLISHLGHISRTSSYPILASSGQFPFLSTRVAIILLKIPKIMEFFCQNIKNSVFFDALEGFLVTKPTNSNDLAELFPIIWWQNTDDPSCSKEKLEESINRISDLHLHNEEVIYELCSLFLNHKLMETNSENFKSFRNFIKTIIEKNQGANRNIPPPGLSEPSVLTNLYFFLLQFLKKYLTSSSIQSFPEFLFYVGNYFDFSRIGGTLSHLQKNLPVSDEQLQDILGEVEFFDDLVMLYHLGVSSRFKHSVSRFQEQPQAISQLEETNNRIKSLKKFNKTEETEYLSMMKRVFRNEVIENIRFCSWNKIILYSKWKQENMFLSIQFLASLLNHFSKKDPLFSYIPEFYVETLIDSFHVLRRSETPFPFTKENNLAGFLCVAQFLIHFDDKRIINPDLRDLLLQSLSVLFQNNEFVRIFEKNFIDKPQLIKALINSYDSRFWITISHLFLRFWKGVGFAQSQKKIESSSPIFQKVFKDVCESDQSILDGFLNRIFNNVNWAITEFGVASKEFRNAIIRHQISELQSLQRKCVIMFELSVTLLKMIEFISIELPLTFLNFEMHITRLCETLIFVLNRTTTGPDAKIFDEMLLKEFSSIERINRAPILAPIVGIITNLYSFRDSGKTSLSSILVSTAGFNLKTFEFLSSVNWKRGTDEKLVERLSILNSFLTTLQSDFSNRKEEDSLNRSESGEFCSICYSAPIDTTFEPCNHRSCNLCIQRHLLNNTKCFFCNAEIKNVIKEK